VILKIYKYGIPMAAEMLANCLVPDSAFRDLSLKDTHGAFIPSALHTAYTGKLSADEARDAPGVGLESAPL
jgi:hypothetical protein